MTSYLPPARLVSLISRSLKYATASLPKVNIVREPSSREPLISVIIPTYNWSSVLKLAIHSVLWQTEQNFEILVIGDGCTDDSERTVASFGDTRIRWHNLPTNSGHQATPNNTGASMARGQYIATLGHDDIWHPQHLEYLLATIQSQNTDIASAFIEMIGPERSNFRVLNGVYPRGGFTATEAIVPSGLIMRRDVPSRIGGWKDYRLISQNPDLDFVQRAYRAGCRFASTQEITVFKFNSALRKNSYRERPCHEQAAYVARIESDRWFMLREALAISKIHLLRLPMTVPQFTPPPDSKTMGWEVTQYREYRGLE